MVREQNFLSDFFGLVKKIGEDKKSELSSLKNEEEDEQGKNNWNQYLSTVHDSFKDPKAEKRLSGIPFKNLISELLIILFDFDHLKENLVSVIDLGLKYDVTFCIGMMVSIEANQKEYYNTCHSFVLSLLEYLHKKVEIHFEKFVHDQIKGIEESKVSSKKRMGVLPFMRVFPKFVDRIEKMLSNWDGNTRKAVDRMYAKIIKCIFESLDQCAQQLNNDSKNSDEKDSLNIHILTVENMHHFYTEIRARKVPALEEYVKQSKYLYDMNMDQYSKVVIRKPLGKLLVL